MEGFEKLSELNDKFIENVLLHFFDGITKENSFLKAAGLNGNNYILSLSNQVLFAGKPKYQPKTNTVIHFTSLRALHAILNSQQLRLSSLNNTNDPNEFTLLGNKLSWSTDLVNEYKQQNFFISFCNIDVLESDNVLNMWRLYGHNGYGCALEFTLDCSRFDQRTNTDFIFGQIDYSYPSMETYKSEKFTFEIQNNINVDDRPLFRGPCCFHKSALFKIEQELRLVAKGSSVSPMHSFTPKSNISYDFNSRDKAMPFLNIPLFWEGGTIPEKIYPTIQLKKIHLGFQHTGAQFKEIEEHLSDSLTGLQRHKDWPDVEIVPSPMENIFY